MFDSHLQVPDIVDMFEHSDNDARTNALIAGYMVCPRARARSLALSLSLFLSLSLSLSPCIILSVCVSACLSVSVCLSSLFLSVSF